MPRPGDLFQQFLGKISQRVLGLAVLPDLEVQMGTGGHACRAHGAHHFARSHGIARLHGEVPAMGVEGLQAVSMVDAQEIALR